MVPIEYGNFSERKNCRKDDLGAFSSNFTGVDNLLEVSMGRASGWCVLP